MVTAGKNAWPPNAAFIDINREEQIVFWTGELRVSTLMLRQAIRFVGSQLNDVSLFLTTGRLPEQTRDMRR